MLRLLSAPGRAAAVSLAAAGTCAVLLLSACGSDNGSGGGLPNGRATLDQVNRGRYLVTSLACGTCHNRGKIDPSDRNWLGGYIGQAGGTGPGAFEVGPFHTYAPNITPDVATGLGAVSDRQLFNELRYGLDPKATPDVVITSTTPGQGNFPATPHYLAPPMPWPSFRHLTDDDTWAIVAYIHHGIKAVSNQSPPSQGPPDFWASSYTPDQIGPATFGPYPSSNEQFNPQNP